MSSMYEFLLRQPSESDEKYRRNVPEALDARRVGQRDRDRIIYTAAFRRLAGVTQVVSAHEGHLFHNRITHSLEVSQIGRRLAERLWSVQPELALRYQLDPDIVEGACLAHDLGHPPFGHAAEEELDRCVKFRAEVDDGFEGNAQTFRVLTKLAVRHHEPRGLNLTRATLDGVLKYPWFKQPSQRKRGAYTSETNEFNWVRDALHPKGDRSLSVEAEVMDIADDIAYAVADVEDFYRGGLIPLAQLAADVRRPTKPAAPTELAGFLKGVFQRWKREGTRPKDGSDEELEGALRRILDWMPVDEAYRGKREERVNLRNMTSGLIATYVKSVRLLDSGPPYVNMTRQQKLEVTMLKEFTWHYVIKNPSLQAQQYGQKRIVRDLFDVFWEEVLDPDKDRSLLPLTYSELLEESEADCTTEQQRKQVRARVAADIVAGMSEQQAIEMHQRLTGSVGGTVLDPIVR